MVFQSFLGLILLVTTGLDITVNVRDGDVIERERKFRVVATLEKQVSQVEFYVGDELRDSDTSIPYEFTIDPITENEGDVELRFVVYTEDGEAGRVAVKVRFDAGISKGAPFHVEQAERAISESKWDDAIISGRIAMRADPDNVRARILMSRAYVYKGVLDKAQQLAEDALGLDASNREAKDLLVYINLRRAFSAPAGGANSSAAFENMKKAIAAAATSRHEFLVGNLQALGAPTDENRIAYADAAMKAERYSLAISALTTAYSKKPSAALANRLALAQARTAKYPEALATLRAAERDQVLDAYGYALRAMILAIGNDHVLAEEALTEAISNDPESAAVQIAQLWVAVLRGNVGNLSALTNAMLANHAGVPEASYYLGILHFRLGNPGAGTSTFREAILAEPGLHDLYLELANQAMVPFFSREVPSGDDAEKALATIDMYLTAAQAVRPDGADVLTCRAIYYYLKGMPNESVSMARAATNAARTYAPAQYLASSIYASAQVLLRSRISELQMGGEDRRLDSQEAAELARTQADYETVGRLSVETLTAAGEIDPRLKGRPTPKIANAFNFFFGYGRMPVFPMPKS